MIIFRTKMNYLKVPALAFSIGLSIGATAQTKKSKPMQIPRPKMAEMHRSIAEMHTKMANCLESTKDLTVCREEMNKSCELAPGAHCQMMGKRKMGQGGMGMMNGSCFNGMMDPASDESEVVTKPLKK